MDRGNFMTLRQAMLQSRSSDPGFEYDAEVICLPVFSPHVWEGYPCDSKSDLVQMLMRAEVSGRASALMAALRVVGEERHI
eukprot:5018446-Alexandrium_andersonii.AAC.1